MKFGAASLMLVLLVDLSSASCSSSNSDVVDTASGAVGGPVSGPADDHCESRPRGVSDPKACTGLASDDTAAGSDQAAGGAASDEEAAGGAGSAARDCNQAHDADYGETMYNDSGDDDDCKYHLSWTSTPIRKGAQVTFSVTLTSKADGAPLERIAAQQPGAFAVSRIEPFIPCKPAHRAPAADLKAPIRESAPGVYSVGPVVFDESARWAIRFHLYEECVDSITSPHGHAAFFVDVP